MALKHALRCGFYRSTFPALSPMIKIYFVTLSSLYFYDITTTPNVVFYLKDRLLIHGLRHYNRPWTKTNYSQSPAPWNDHMNSVKRFFNQLPTPIRHLMYANGAVFALFHIAPGFAFSNFTIKPGDIGHGKIYTPLTSIFGHFGLIHFGFNMLMLYFYGPMVLNYLSVRQFYTLYLSSGCLGSLAALSTMAPNGATLGASGSIFGIMSFVTMKAPNSSILLYGVFPMKLWQLMALVVLIESLMLSSKLRKQQDYGGHRYSSGGVGISNEAHLTGIATGFAYYYAFTQGML